jgi:hypothetical protein
LLNLLGIQKNDIGKNGEQETKIDKITVTMIPEFGSKTKKSNAGNTMPLGLLL